MVPDEKPLVVEYSTNELADSSVVHVMVAVVVVAEDEMDEIVGAVESPLVVVMVDASEVLQLLEPSQDLTRKL
jgi:hypothetical protein